MLAPKPTADTPAAFDKVAKSPRLLVSRVERETKELWEV